MQTISAKRKSVASGALAGTAWGPGAATLTQDQGAAPPKAPGFQPFETLKNAFPRLLNPFFARRHDRGHIIQGFFLAKLQMQKIQYVQHNDRRLLSNQEVFCEMQKSWQLCLKTCIFCISYPVRHSWIGHTYKKRIVSVVVRQMFVLCSLNVLFMSCCHPPKSVTDGQRLLGSPGSGQHPPNLELYQSGQIS